MAASPRWKLYTADGRYEGSVKCLVMAAACMCVLGKGATVRNGHRKQDTVYIEGTHGDSAESWDAVANHVHPSRIS